MARKENPYAYHLIDEEIHYSGHHEESGWDTDHRGAGGEYPGTREFRFVKSIGNEFPSFRRRNITEETSGVITYEGLYQIVSGDGFYIGFFGDKGDEKEAFVLRQNDGFIYAADKALFKVDYEWHYLKFVIDIDNGKVKVHRDGKYVTEAPFTGKAKTISRFEIGYAAGDVGEAMIHADLELYKNYLFNDSIISKIEGSLPEEYVVEKSGKVVTGRRRYSPASKYACYYVKAGSGSNTNIIRRFDRANGNVGFEIKYLLPKKGAKLAVSLMSFDTEVVTIYDELKEIYTKEGALRAHSPNVWQTLRIEADTNTNTALIRLNGKAVSTINFDNEAEFIDGMKLAFDCEKAVELQVSDIKAFVIPPYPADYVPEPVIPKKKGDYYVGMNICSLWREGTHYGWDCITPFPENKPLIGYYDEGVTETADWELKWMAEHGLDFQLYCWYSSEAQRPMLKTGLSAEIHDGHMLAKYGDKVKLALLWEASACVHPTCFEDVRDYIFPYFIDYFFSDPRYMQIDGYAIMSIYAPDRLASDVGGPAEARRCFDYLRKEVKKLGYKGLIVMCCGDNNPIYKECGIDAVHAYNWGINGWDVEFTKDRVLGNIREGSCHTVPTVSMGFNHTGWTGIRTPVLDPKDMVTLLEWSKDEVLTTYEKDSWKSKLVMLSTWNEYGEGTYMCPAGVHGFGYLDALRTVFMEDVPHADVIPNQDQLDRICILHPQDRILLAPHDNLPPDTNEYPLIKRYEFKTEEDLKKWEIVNVDKYEIRDGKLCGHSDSTDWYKADPRMYLHDDEFFPISTEKIGKIVTNIRTYKPVDAACCIQQSYLFGPDKWSGQPACISVPDRVAPLVIEPAKHHKFPWHETLYGFRLDPVWREGDFELESVEFYAAPPHKILYIDGKIVDLKHNPTEEDGLVYISFDTKSDLKKLPNLYYEWYEGIETLKVYSKKNAEFVIGSDIVVIDGVEVKMAKPLDYYDGVPNIQADILCDILGMEMELDDISIKLSYKK